MEYRKIVMSALVLAIILATSTCFAQITNSSSSSQTAKQKRQQDTVPYPEIKIAKSELNIGGINLEHTMDYVEKIYGKPSHIEDQDPYLIYNYNDAFFIVGRPDDGNKVLSITIYEEGLKTPSGFTVGTPFAEVVKKYGKVKPVKFKDEASESNSEKLKDYTYFCGFQQMVFIVDKEGMIRGIRVEELDDKKYLAALLNNAYEKKYGKKKIFTFGIISI